MCHDDLARRQVNHQQLSNLKPTADLVIYSDLMLLIRWFTGIWARLNTFTIDQIICLWVIFSI